MSAEATASEEAAKRQVRPWRVVALSGVELSRCQQQNLAAATTARGEWNEAGVSPVPAGRDWASARALSQAGGATQR